MAKRREILSMGLPLGLAMLGLSGCTTGTRRPAPPMAGIIDAHIHLFNGRDVPVLGFLQQVDLSDAQNVPGQEIRQSALVRLLITILRSGTLSAADELGRGSAFVAESSSRSARPAGDAGDQQRLAAALTEFQSRPDADVARGTVEVQSDAGRVQSMSVRTASGPSPRAEDDALLAAIETVAEVTPQTAPQADATGAFRSTAMSRSAPAARASAEEVAASAYERRADGTYVRWHPLIALLRWVVMLTRPRAAILAEAISLYGGSGRAQVFANQIVDFELWFKERDAALSPVIDQVRVMRRIAGDEQRALVLNFVPFCPMRAVADPGFPLAQVRDAVMNYGCAGVKLYPPLGFRPRGNAALRFAHTQHDTYGAAEGQRMDQALNELYRWCSDNDVPILAHASPTMGAGPGTAANAAPAFWSPILGEFPDLRVNLAHVGGFQNHSAPNGRGTSWVTQLALLMQAHRNLFFDTGFLSEADQDDPERRDAADQLGRLLADPVARERIMYASDWTMIARVPDHPRYLDEVQRFMGGIIPGGDVAGFMGGNARRWLGLDRAGAQHRRLAATYGRNPVWQQMFA